SGRDRRGAAPAVRGDHPCSRRAVPDGAQGLLRDRAAALGRSPCLGRAQPLPRCERPFGTRTGGRRRKRGDCRLDSAVAREVPMDAGVDSRHAWFRLAVSLALMTIGGCGMYVVVVVLPSVQAEFGVARGTASLPYTLTMIGFGIGGIWMGRLSDR